MKFASSGQANYPGHFTNDQMPPPYTNSPTGGRLGCNGNQYSHVAYAGIPEFGNQSPFGNLDDKNLRRGFIRKVFSILLVQLSVTFGFVLLSYQFEGLQEFVRRTPALYFVSYVTFLVTYITLACCKGVARKTPWNYVFLSLLTISMTYMLAMITAFHSSEIVMVALIITICVCFAIIMFSMQTKYDFTGAIGPLFAASIALLVLGIIAIFWRNKIVHILYSGLGAILFAAFLAVDVQMIVGGKRFEISAEDYIFGALMLYLDIVYIFIYLVSLFSSVRE